MSFANFDDYYREMTLPPIGEVLASILRPRDRQEPEQELSDDTNTYPIESSTSSNILTPTPCTPTTSPIRRKSYLMVSPQDDVQQRVELLTPPPTKQQNVRKSKTSVEVSAPTGRQGRWSTEEHAQFLLGVAKHGNNFTKIQKLVPTRTAIQIFQANTTGASTASSLPLHTQGTACSSKASSTCSDQPNTQTRTKSRTNKEGKENNERERAVKHGRRKWTRKSSSSSMSSSCSDESDDDYTEEKQEEVKRRKTSSKRQIQ